MLLASKPILRQLAKQQDWAFRTWVLVCKVSFSQLVTTWLLSMSKVKTQFQYQSLFLFTGNPYLCVVFGLLCLDLLFYSPKAQPGICFKCAHTMAAFC